MTAIEWADKSWNPVTGCHKVSLGCKNCYAERVAERWWQGRKFIDVKTHAERLNGPKKWKKGQRIFTCSMSDLFQPLVPDDFIDGVFETIEACPQHTFLLLTKRPARMWDYLQHRGPRVNRPVPENIYCGVSIENIDELHRLQALHAVPCPMRFISFEPLLGPVHEELKASGALGGIDWVIVGGESGPQHRPIEADWVRGIRDECERWGVPFFFKQWGGKRAKSGGAELDGRLWREFPPDPRLDPLELPACPPAENEQSSLL